MMARRILGALSVGFGGMLVYPRAAAPWASDSSDGVAAVSAGSKVVVIGGGVAGCVTAFRLAQRGYRPIIVEAQDELSGPASATWGNACLVSTNGFTDFSSPGVFLKSVLRRVRHVRCFGILF